MKKNILGIFLILTMGLFFACKSESDDTGGNKSMEFSCEQYNVFIGKSVECVAENVETCEFSVTNEKIAEILSSSGNSCRVTGNKVGATVLTAVNGDEKCKCIINVEKEKDERNVALKDKQWYMCSVLTDFGGSTFFTLGEPELSFDGEVIRIKKENDYDFYCHINNFVSMEYSCYEEAVK